MIVVFWFHFSKLTTTQPKKRSEHSPNSSGAEASVSIMRSEYYCQHFSKTHNTPNLLLKAAHFFLPPFILLVGILDYANPGALYSSFTFLNDTLGFSW